MSCKLLWIWQLSPRWKIMHLINCYSAEMSSYGKAVPQTQHLAFSFCLLCCHEANMNSEDLCRAGSRRAHCQKSIIRALISCTDQWRPYTEKIRQQQRQYNRKENSLWISTWIYSNEHYLNERFFFFLMAELFSTELIIYNGKWNAASLFDKSPLDCCGCCFLSKYSLYTIKALKIMISETSEIIRSPQIWIEGRSNF